MAHDPNPATVTQPETAVPFRHAALLCAMAMLFLCSSTNAQQNIQTSTDGQDLIVRTQHYSAVIRTSLGGRIVSLAVDGVELTAMPDHLHGGLLEETNTADLGYQTILTERDEERLRVVMRGRRGAVQVTRDMTFQAGSPAILCTFTFENTGRVLQDEPFRPGIRNLALPDARPTGREVYCMDRGRGAETIGAWGLAAQLETPSPAGMRWMAVCSPTARRSIGFALDGSAARALPPVRAAENRITGWSWAPVAPGQSLTATVTVAVLPGFGAVSEMNGRFAVNTTVAPKGVPPTATVAFMALKDDMPDVSCILRMIGADGTEHAPCDAILLPTAQPGVMQTETVEYPAVTSGAGWLAHSLFERTRSAGEFLSQVGTPDGAPPTPAGHSPARPSAPPALPLQTEIQHGLTLADITGQAPKLALHLCRNERRTEFLQIRATENIEKVRMTLVASDSDREDAFAIAPQAVTLWRVTEPSEGGPAVLIPLDDFALAADMTAFIAVSIDSKHLRRGLNSGALLLVGNDGAIQAPLEITLEDVALPSPSDFAVWHLGDGTSETPSRTAAAQAASYGAQLAFMPPACCPDLRESALQARRLDLQGLGLRSPGNARPPARNAGGLAMLTLPKPLWLVDADAAMPSVPLAAHQTGYATALRTESLKSLIKRALPAPGFCIVDDGVEPDATERAIDQDILAGSSALFLHVDLRETAWQTCPLALRRALWAAAWQGLAGVAVTMPEPGDDPQRQPAIWHVLRDARTDVALWQHASRLATRASRDKVLSDLAERRLAELEFAHTIGTGRRNALRVVRERRSGRDVLRIAAAPEPQQLADAFAKARLDSMEALRVLNGAPWEQGERNAYWQGRPMVRDERVIWSVMAADGDVTWRAALGLQRALHKMAGHQPKVGRTVPTDLANVDILWIIADNTPTVAVPAPVTAALEADRNSPLVAADLGDNRIAIVLRDPELVPELVSLIDTQPYPFAPASEVR